MTDPERLPEAGPVDESASAAESAEQGFQGTVGIGEAANPAEGFRHVGVALEARRLQLSLSLEEVAARMKVSPRLLAAIEVGRWSEFTSLAVLRGFVRAYAKVIELDVETLLGTLPIFADGTVLIARRDTLSAPMPSATRRTNASWWLGSAALGAVVIGAAILVGRSGGLVSGFVTELLPKSASRPEEQKPTSVPAVSESAPAAPAAPQQMPPSPPSPLQTIPTPAVTERMGDTVAGAALPSKDAELVAMKQRSAAPQLRIDIENESWVEVVDAAGRVLVSSLQPAGASQELNGRAPLTIVIGNAPGVRVEYAGHLVDLGPYTRGNVARLALN